MENLKNFNDTDHVQFKVFGTNSQWYDNGNGLTYLKLASRIWDLCEIAEGRNQRKVTLLAADILNDAGLALDDNKIFGINAIANEPNFDFIHEYIIPEMVRAMGVQFDPMGLDGLIELLNENLDGMTKAKLAFALWFLYDYPETAYYDRFVQDIADSLKY
jgi:hypothetical protein